VAPRWAPINNFTRELFKKNYFYFLITKLQLHNISLVSTFNQLFTIIFLLNRSSRMQKRTAWPRADYLINKPRFMRIGELIKCWTRVGLKRVGEIGWSNSLLNCQTDYAAVLGLAGCWPDACVYIS